MADPFVRSVVLKRDEVESFDAYPFSIPAIGHLTELDIGADVTLLAGENGSGKSTLVEAIAVALGFNAEGGSRNMSVSTRDSHSPLHERLRVVRGARTARNGFFLRAESFFNVATHIEQLDQEPGGGRRIIDAYGGTSLHEQSHGESFLSLILNRFGPNGLYILDERQPRVDAPDARPRRRRLAVHHRDALTDSPRISRRTHLRPRRRGNHGDEVRGHRAVRVDPFVPRRSRTVLALPLLRRLTQ
jgi:predicted ATPase